VDIKRLTVATVVWAVASVAAGPAFAQGSGPGGSDDAEGTSTVILQFDTTNVSQDILDTFYVSLNEMVNGHPEMHVVSGGEVTIQELSVTVGCDQLDPECLTSLQEYVSAERMVFGTIQRSGDVHLFTLKLFDFDEEEFVRKVEERTIEGDKSVLERAIPAVVENFLYGDVGRLKVDAENAKRPIVYFDGEKMGPAPVQLNKLPLGQHAVTVESADGREKTQFVMLRKEGTESITFEFEEEAETGGGEGPPTAALSVAGVGVAGLAVGIIGSAQNAKFRNQADQLKCPGGGRACSPSGQRLTTEEVALKAEQTDKKVRSTAMLSTVGYSVAAAGLGVGGYLLYRHFSGSGVEREPTAAEAVRVTPRKDGVSVGLSLDF
jgi:hypothetical protein